jgi:cysteine desulfurase / selenocysteine lyase
MIKDIRSEFTALDQKVNGKPLVYLDSAATSLKPKTVVDALTNFYKYETANVHRGAHYLADKATQKFEGARETVRQFINAKSVNEIVFTKGTTESLNLVASTYARKNLNAGDEILLSEMEHHSNIVPWQMIAEERGATVVFTNVTDAGEIDFEDFQKKLNKRTKIVSLTLCSNALGTVVPIEQFVRAAKDAGATTVVDAAQAVSFNAIDVTKIECDFLVFSAHKIYGPYGVGVLYGREEILNAMPPYQGGGAMISEVTKAKTTFLKSPQRFEAGTPNISGVIGLGVAINFLQGIGLDKVREHERSILRFALDEMKGLNFARVIGTTDTRVNLFSFVFNDAHPLDVGQILDQQGVAVRVGHHCAQPLMKRFEIGGTVRASFGIYNNFEDVEHLVKALKKAQELLK